MKKLAVAMGQHYTRILCCRRASWKERESLGKESKVTWGVSADVRSFLSRADCGITEFWAGGVLLFVCSSVYVLMTVGKMYPRRYQSTTSILFKYS